MPGALYKYGPKAQLPYTLVHRCKKTTMKNFPPNGYFVCQVITNKVKVTFQMINV